MKAMRKGLSFLELKLQDPSPGGREAWASFCHPHSRRAPLLGSSDRPHRNVDPFPKQRSDLQAVLSWEVEGPGDGVEVSLPLVGNQRILSQIRVSDSSRFASLLPSPRGCFNGSVKRYPGPSPAMSCNVPISEILKKPGSSGASPKSLTRRVPQCSAGLHLIQPFAACKQPRVSQELTDAQGKNSNYINGAQ